MISCPSCLVRRANAPLLVLHMMKSHGLSLQKATDKARLVVRDAERQDKRVAKKARP